jgi:hypothetical protein
MDGTSKPDHMAVFSWVSKSLRMLYSTAGAGELRASLGAQH